MLQNRQVVSRYLFQQGHKGRIFHKHFEQCIEVQRTLIKEGEGKQHVLDRDAVQRHSSGKRKNCLCSRMWFPGITWLEWDEVVCNGKVSSIYLVERASGFKPLFSH